MARCAKCNKYVGCSCNLESGLCAQCVEAKQEAELKAAQEKVAVQVKIPKDKE